MIDEKVISALKERYKHVHPLIFQRSLERSKTAGDLFDILDTVPKKLPIIWSEENKKWETTKDLFQSKKFSVK
jgi:hypothetical protein